MDLQLLTESNSFVVSFNNLKLNEATEKAIDSDGTLFITLPVCKLDAPTMNNRIYSTEEMKRALKEAMPAIKGRRLLCSGDDHPTTSHVPPIQASHVLVDAWIKESVLWNKWQVLDTQNGKNLRALIKGRAAVGTSIRGLGQVDESTKNVKNYRYCGTDCVGNPAAGTYALDGEGGVSVEVLESVNAFSESIGIPIKGLGSVNQNSIIQYHGRSWRVSNISGSPERWQMTLYPIDDEGNSEGIWITSDMVSNPADDIRIIKESNSKGNDMSKLNFYLHEIQKNKSKLDELRKNQNLTEELSLIARFEYLLSEDRELTKDDLKRVIEEWDKAKKEAGKIVTTEEQLRNVAESVLQLKNQFDSLKLAVLPSSNTSSNILENEQKIVQLIQSMPGGDRGLADEVLSSWYRNRDDKNSFVREVSARLASRNLGWDYDKLFDDITAASGEYAYTGQVKPNEIATVSAVEYEKLESLVNEFCTRIEEGKLIYAEKIQSVLVDVLHESRKLVNRYRVREALAVEMLVEAIAYSAMNTKNLRVLSESFNNLWQAAQVIIEQLKVDVLKAEGRVVPSQSKIENVEKNITLQLFKNPDWI